MASAVETIGNTPIVELKRLAHDFDGRILAKLEYFNPGFSKKERVMFAPIICTPAPKSSAKPMARSMFFVILSEPGDHLPDVPPH